jgi:hypothetical protein
MVVVACVVQAGSKQNGKVKSRLSPAFVAFIATAAVVEFARQRLCHQWGILVADRWKVVEVGGGLRLLVGGPARNSCGQRVE